MYKSGFLDLYSDFFYNFKGFIKDSSQKQNVTAFSLSDWVISQEKTHIDNDNIYDIMHQILA